MEKPTGPPRGKTGDTRPRDVKGRLLPSPDAPERDAEAFRMRSRECTFAEIAIALGYGNASVARNAVDRHLARIVKPEADAYRKIMDDQLSEMHRQVLRVLEATHYKVNAGVVVYHRPADCGCPRTDADGDFATCEHYKPLTDDAPVLAAVDRLLKIQDRRAKMYGLDAPARVEAQVSQVTIKIEGADDV